MSIDEQQAVLIKVQETVGEHCNAYIFVAIVEGTDGNPSTILKWDGGGLGTSVAFGMLQSADALIRRNFLRDQDDRPDDFENS